MVIKDKEDLSVMTLVMAISGSRAFLESDARNIHEMEEMVLDFVEHSAEQPIFFVMRDKKIKQASKALAQAAWNEFVGATKRQDYVGCREAISRGAQDIVRTVIGEEAFTVVKERLSPYCKMWINWDDAQKEEMQLIMIATGRGIRKELARRLIYTGSID